MPPYSMLDEVTREGAQSKESDTTIAEIMYKSIWFSTDFCDFKITEIN